MDGRERVLLDNNTCKDAAKYGHLSYAQWARENECGWNCNTYAAAQRGGNRDVINYGIRQGCPRY